MPEASVATIPSFPPQRVSEVPVVVNVFSPITAEELNESLAVVAAGDKNVLFRKDLWFSVEEGEFGVPPLTFDLLGIVACPRLKTLFFVLYEGTQFFDRRLSRYLKAAADANYVHRYILVSRRAEGLQETPLWFNDSHYAGYLASLMTSGVTPLFVENKILMKDIVAKTLVKIALHTEEGRVLALDRRRKQG
jgi:hypothetical protein